jgi:hypothetical protein
MWQFGAFVFALMLLVMSFYYLISYIRGTVPNRTGIASIIGFMAACSYFAFIGSHHGAAHRQSMMQMLFRPIQTVAENTTRGVISGMASGVVRSAVDGISSVAGIAAVGATTLATTTMASFTALNFSAVLASLLAGPLGVYVIPILAMVFSVGS